MTRVLLFHLDGKIPNLALMRIYAHHKALGDDVELRRTGQPEQAVIGAENYPDKVYGSAIFLDSLPVARRLLAAFPNAIIGGTGWDFATTLEGIGIHSAPDYAAYPNFRQSIGFTQRGCRLKCEFCVVPKKEGAVRQESTIADIWRGDPWPRELLLLDNDFFGQPEWRKRIAEIRDGKLKVSFNQGINARCITEEAAEAIASVDYRDDSMSTKRIYTAWDSKSDEARLFAGLNRLVKYGVKPDHIMVYMLVGYWPDETAADREYRRYRLRAFGARPYPMPYVRTLELVGLQRFCMGAYDKDYTWQQWERNGYRPEGLIPNAAQMTIEIEPEETLCV